MTLEDIPMWIWIAFFGVIALPISTFVAWSIGKRQGHETMTLVSTIHSGEMSAAFRAKHRSDLDPKWFSKPVTARNIFNLILYHVKLQFEGYDGTACIIHNIDREWSLNDRDQNGIRRLVPVFMDAIIELGDELKTHRDFILVDERTTRA